MPYYYDSRFFTSYLPNCDLDNALRQKAGNLNDFEYRMFLQKNALAITQMQNKRIFDQTLKLTNEKKQ